MSYFADLPVQSGVRTELKVRSYKFERFKFHKHDILYQVLFLGYFSQRMNYESIVCTILSDSTSSAVPGSNMCLMCCRPLNTASNSFTFPAAGTFSPCIPRNCKIGFPPPVCGTAVYY
eukprot:GHVR01094671.1.p1 GENE.GHVR01094671.1~~GHVR01094671.1.p1  ORF type:complete len:118 (-),score=3.90 GHVR01094671.1:158-511(-)